MTPPAADPPSVTEPAPLREQGRRALSDGIAAAVVSVFCYFTACRAPFLREAYWAPIAAIVVLYPGVDATRKAGLERFLGTLIGSGVGWAAAAWWQQHVLAYGLAVLAAVGLCTLLRLENASRLCAVTVTVITLIPRPEPPHLVALSRCVEVSYGLACALAYTTLADFFRRRLERRRKEPASG